MNSHQFRIIVALLTMIINHLRGHEREVFYNDSTRELENT